MARAAQAASRPSLKIADFEPGTAKDAMKAVNATTRTLYMVPINSIDIAPGFNLRVTDTPEYKQGIEELKSSILTEGFYQTKPLAGYVAKHPKTGADVIFVTDGHRRLEAAKLAVQEGAELEKLPMILRPATATSVEITKALHRENTGVPLSMLEKAVLVKRLLSSEMTKEEIAQQMGFTTRYVGDLLVLIDAPKEIRALVAEGKVTGTEAVKQLRANADQAAEKLTALAEKAAQRGQKRITAQDTAGSRTGTDGVKLKSYKRDVGVKKGEVVKVEDYQPVIDFFGFHDMFKPTNRPGRIKATMDFVVTAKIRRPEIEEAPAEDTEGAEGAEGAEGKTNGAAEPAKRGRKAKAGEPEPEPVGREVDPMTMQDTGEGEDTGEDGETLDDAADLEQRGIADRAADL